MTDALNRGELYWAFIDQDNEPVFRIDTPSDGMGCEDWQRLRAAISSSEKLTSVDNRGWTLIGSDALPNRMQVKLTSAPSDAEYEQLLDMLDGIIRDLADKLGIETIVVPHRHVSYPQRARKQAATPAVSTLDVIDTECALIDAVA